MHAAPIIPTDLCFTRRLCRARPKLYAQMLCVLHRLASAPASSVPMLEYLSPRNGGLVLALRPALTAPLPAAEKTHECAAALHSMSWVMRLQVCVRRFHIFGNGSCVAVGSVCLAPFDLVCFGLLKHSVCVQSVHHPQHTPRLFLLPAHRLPSSSPRPCTTKHHPPELRHCAPRRRCCYCGWSMQSRCVWSCQSCWHHHHLMLTRCAPQNP